MTDRQTVRPIGPGTEALFKPLLKQWPDFVYVGLRAMGLNRWGVYLYTKQADGTTSFLDGGTIVDALANRLLGAFVHDKTKVLMAPSTMLNAAVLYLAIPRGRVTFESNEAYGRFAKCLSDYALRTVVAEEQASFKVHGIMPELAIDLPVKEGADPPGEHQRVAASCALKAGDYAMFMPMGTGKTYTGILTVDGYYNHRFDRTKNTDYPLRVLIVCPRAVRTNWKTELSKFASTPYDVVIYKGQPIARRRRVIDFITRKNPTADPFGGTEVVYMITTIGMVVQDASILQRVPWDIVIVDESDCIKNESTGRSKSIKAVAENADMRVIMTGTPMPNGPQDLYGQLEFMRAGLGQTGTAKKFKHHFHNIVQAEEGGISVEINTGTKEEHLAQELVALNSFTIPKDQAIKNLPPQLHDVAEVDLSPEQLKVYTDLESQIEVEIDAIVKRGESENLSAGIVIQSVLKATLRLTQVTSGFAVTDPVYDDYGVLLRESTTHHFTPNPKLEWLRDHLRARPKNSKTIVWVFYHEEIRLISAMLHEEGMKHVVYTGKTSDKMRDEAVEAFNGDPDTRVWLSIASAGGIGLNLFGFSKPEDVTNCDGMVYYSRNWDGKVRDQSKDRNHRKGTRVPVQITDLIATGTIDSEIMQRVNDKTATSLRIQDVRQIMRTLSLSV